MSRRRREQESGDESAAFAVECPRCRAHVAVTGRLVGRAAGCPRCRSAFLVPRPDREERRASRPADDGPRAAPAVTAPSPREPARARPARPEPVAPSRPVDGPIAWSQPPVPSMRRLRADALATIPEAASTVGTAAVATASTVTVPDATPTPTTASARDPDVPDGLALEEPVKVIRSGGAEIELRRLTPEERRARRARRNLIILVVGASLLVALVVILGKGGR